MTLAEDIVYLEKLVDRIADGIDLHGYQIGNAHIIRRRLVQTKAPKEYIRLAEALTHNTLPKY